MQHPYSGGTNEFLKFAYILGYLSLRQIREDDLQAHVSKWLWGKGDDEEADERFVQIYGPTEMGKDIRDCLAEFGIVWTRKEYGGGYDLAGDAPDDLGREGDSICRAGMIQGFEQMFAPREEEEEA